MGAMKAEKEGEEQVEGWGDKMLDREKQWRRQEATSRRFQVFRLEAN